MTTEITDVRLQGLRLALPRPVTFLFGLVLGVVATLLAVQAVPLLAPDDFEDGHLILMMDQDQSFGRQRIRLLEEWNALHPEHPVTYIELPSTATAARGHLVAHAQSGAAPVADVYSIDVTWTAEFASAGLIRPLDESRLELDGFLPGPLETGRYDGRQYALPFNTDAGLLFYRKDLIPEPPRTLAELVEQIEAYFQRPPDPDAEDPDSRTDPNIEAGFVGQLGDYEGFTVNALELIWATGEEVVRADGSVAPHTSMVEGVQWLFDGLRPRDGRSIILPDSLDYDEDRSRRAFQEGRVLFMRNWPVAYRLLTEPPPGEDGDPPMDPDLVGVTALPGPTEPPGPSALGGQNLALAATTDQPRAAQALIEFLTSERSQQILFEHGGLAATRGIVYRDANVTSRYPYAETLREAVREAKQRPVTPHYTDFSREFRRVVMEAWANDGEITADHARRLTDALAGRRGG